MDVYEIGNRIKQARTLKNYTLDDIANEIGVAKSTIQRYENGLISKPKLPVLQAIADALNVNPAWLSGQDVPMIIDESLNNIVKNRLKELNMSLEDIVEKAGIPLHWLQNIEKFIPYEQDYIWASKLAEAIGLPGSVLRSALAKQEPPMPDDLPKITAKEAFKDALEDFKEPPKVGNIKVFISKEEQNHLYKYRAIDDHGRELVDTILDKEHERCEASNKVVQLPKENKSYLEPNAANERTDIEVTDEMRRHDDDLMNDDDFWNK